ncbi:preprotein translocase subunit YajC [Croceicoccus sp. F390]|uniref:Sec translocon accessory complex subunit YajC n=1 Tax=Croceicoccus esteveae TaxID=3075597 RepID=A0ABU2ZM76_9SPHN|nr:preprotein translocase subunit YajC [Croceicoccus sp. F390]MDT0576542.1 preprotein translocase subunit YajC [Croceicoccus sp. F390]
MNSPEVLLAAAPVASGPPAIMNLLLLVAMGLIFWFLVFRPQMKRQKAHQAKIAGLKKNDRVVTAGGLVGKIVKLDDQFVEIELAQNVRVKAVRQTIGDVLPANGNLPAND